MKLTEQYQCRGFRSKQTCAIVAIRLRYCSSDLVPILGSFGSESGHVRSANFIPTGCEKELFRLLHNNHNTDTSRLPDRRTIHQREEHLRPPDLMSLYERNYCSNLSHLGYLTLFDSNDLVNDSEYDQQTQDARYNTSILNNGPSIHEPPP